MPTFSPPTRSEAIVASGRRGNISRLWSELDHNVGQTVVRSGGTFTTHIEPSQDVLDTADTVATADLPGGEQGKYLFLGGHVYTVSSAVGTELTNAGYSVS